MAAPRAVEVLLPAALEVVPGLEGAAGDGEEDGEGVGVFVDVTPTEIVGVGAVAVDVATTTLCVTPDGVLVTTVVLPISDCAG